MCKAGKNLQKWSLHFGILIKCTHVSPTNHSPHLQPMSYHSISKIIMGAYIKGTVSRDGYFCWRSKHFNQYFLCQIEKAINARIPWYLLIKDSSRDTIPLTVGNTLGPLSSSLGWTWAIFCPVLRRNQYRFFVKFPSTRISGSLTHMLSFLKTVIDFSIFHIY